MFDEDWVYFQALPSEMTFINRIIEGCDYLGVVTALDGKKGIGFVRTTKDTAGETIEQFHAGSKRYILKDSSPCCNV